MRGRSHSRARACPSSWPGGGSWTVQRQDVAWAVDRGWPERPADALVRVPSDALWRVATRGIPVEAAREQAMLSGDHVLGSAMLHLVSIIR